MYEYVDKDRFDMQELYWDFMEKGEEDIEKGIKALKKIIKKDPNFFETYVILAEYYDAKGADADAFSTLKEGYDRAMSLIMPKGKFPDKLEWLHMENRHIARIIFQYAMRLWEIGEKSEALRIFKQLLSSNPNDNIGARYAIVALLEGLPSIQAYEEMFETDEGYLDATKVENWFEKVSKKYLDEIGWWFELDDE